MSRDRSSGPLDTLSRDASPTTVLFVCTSLSGGGAERFVSVVASGAVVTEAMEAVRFLIAEEVDANLVIVTSADRLAARLHEVRLASVRTGAAGDLGQLETLFPESHRRTPMVTVMDGASHTLAFLGGAFGAPVVPLGTDVFGQSGTIPDLYAAMGIDTQHIIEAALLATDGSLG